MKVLQAGFNLGWLAELPYCPTYDTSCRVNNPALILIIRHICAPLAIFVFLIHKYCTTRKIVDNREIVVLHNEQSLMPTRYSYTDVVAMTNNFEDKLGPQGGLGSVYKGQLPDGCLIVVKMLENSRFRGTEFINEVRKIGRIRHANVLQWVGFCSEGYKQALVYEYMPNGLLLNIYPQKKEDFSHLSGKSCTSLLCYRSRDRVSTQGK
ncbi:LEAF RUST 10 DISEASE-RESISTANCE LOCUS RECEPTOR-LIKE PROTEIN KINASE-like 2.5 [Prunus dulcis]|uniref:LEAF RUST 10 DISEASE-RESISTANCE LOCUS RECEPTOR-LIKE PROTEIN KINASE-like 2.5 n=1 Tax=Prunus dulcis TaxID=3755 RepID=UPI0014838352|nr:LEAF RUST 10 DISEASE-RESISTANCE LOCUS RECEPTOR-LIKE PROTEIN KINASE-like 2.5 [Prunus dulcis]